MQSISPVDDYIERLSLSSNTKRVYRGDLRAFEAWLRGRSIELRDASVAGAADYLVELRELGRRHSTVSRSAVVLRRYLRYQGQEVHKAFPSFDSYNSFGSALPVDRLLSVLDELPARSPLELRDRAMLELLYATGLRVSELVALDVCDVALGVQMVGVKNRFGLHRRLPISSYTAELLGHMAFKKRPATAFDTQGKTHCDLCSLRKCKLRTR